MDNMNPKLKRILVFFRLIDSYDENISFTNVALIVVLTKLMFVQTTSIVDIGALLVSLANFNLKKYINSANMIQGMADNLKQKTEEISSS
jgi:hypothetical protein